MSLVRALTEKPWLTPGLDESVVYQPTNAPAAALTGLRLYFGVASVMFVLVGAAYLMHRGVGHDMAMDDGAGSGRLPSLPLLWFNTAILALDSLAWRRARVAAAAGSTERLRPALLMGGGLAILFLVGQAVAWWQLRPMAPASAITFFYLISALHGLHLVGGLVAWGRTLAGLSPDADQARVAVRVRLCADYWHFLLLVWLAMFALLLAA
jgi:cytochrome c oxidase subunit III